MLNENLRYINDASSLKSQIIYISYSKITVISDNIFRIETNKDKIFTESATQAIINRNLGPCEFEKNIKKNMLYIKTNSVVLKFNIKNNKPISIKFIKENIVSKCNNKHNLKGTKRTLDMAFRKVRLENGIMSKDGVSIYDDSNSLIFDENGIVQKRKTKEKDIYIFAFYNDYQNALRQFYKLTGNVPLIPRYALGVWWSRYKAYSQDEYKKLIIDFKDHNIPLTVATIDMDWHLVDIKGYLKQDYIKENIKVSNRFLFFDGWTGYTWNESLFYDYKELLSWLSKQDLKITLNLHPSDGVRYFEKQYEEFAKRLNFDTSSKKPIKFSLKDDYINAYFDILHHPYEKDGVDFWWIDWQQGNKSDIEGLDPLWALNHYHYLDNKSKNTNPLILSRYAGVGSHRYPLGFSGDTFINWKILDFIPYFTITANNIGYCWWSHDIGGHHFGYKDDELYIRWIQFATFNPILRLHSSSDDLLGKEPYNFTSHIKDIAIDFLQLRSKLIPYLHSLNYNCHLNAIPLINAMYYFYPNNKKAYKYKNQYLFGNLLVSPITSKTSKNLNMAKVNVWLPDGVWTDIFTNKKYKGNKEISIYRDLSSIPVFAKQGSIIPLNKNVENGAKNPKELEVLIYNGNGDFKMYEDDDNSCLSSTTFSISHGKNISFKIKVDDNENILHKTRTYILKFKNISKCFKYEIIIDGNKRIYENEVEILSDKTFEITLNDINKNNEIFVNLLDYIETEFIDYKNHIIDIMAKYQTFTLYKSIKYKKIIKHIDDKEKTYKTIKKMIINKDVKKALLEAF